MENRLLEAEQELKLLETAVAKNAEVRLGGHGGKPAQAGK